MLGEPKQGGGHRYRSMSVWIALALVTLLWGPRPVGADPNGETVYTGQGSGGTYQNNYADECQWYDYRSGSGDPCWRGVYSFTDTPSGQTAYVYQMAAKQGDNCAAGGWPGGSGECGNWYHFFPPPYYYYESSASSFTSTTHYFCGYQSCGWPVNVVGYANHYNLTYSYSWYFYTEALQWVWE